MALSNIGQVKDYLKNTDINFDDFTMNGEALISLNMLNGDVFDIFYTTAQRQGLTVISTGKQTERKDNMTVQEVIALIDDKNEYDCRHPEEWLDKDMDLEDVLGIKESPSFETTFIDSLNEIIDEMQRENSSSPKQIELYQFTIIQDPHEEEKYIISYGNKKIGQYKLHSKKIQYAWAGSQTLDDIVDDTGNVRISARFQSPKSEKPQ